MNAIKALELAYGKGKIKKWALESTIIETLYDTKLEHCCYLKLKDTSGLSYDVENETEYIVRFGYTFRIPKTEVDLHIVKSSGQMYLTKEGIGYGYDKVEDSVVEYLLKEKVKGNLYLKTNLNFLEFPIK